MATSQNGFRANDISLTKVWDVPGTDRHFRLRNDDCGYVLVHFAAWYHRNVEPITHGIWDEWGYAERAIRGSSTTLSNHASGTAIDINATKHPLGVRGTHTEAQKDKIRHELRTTYEGVIRAGLDYRNRVDAMHYEIDRPYADVQRVARKLRAQAAGKPQGAPEPPAKVLKPKPTLPVSDISNIIGQFRNPTKDLPGVRAVQEALNAHRGLGPVLKVDGNAGPKTKAAYAAFQRGLGYRGADANGIPGEVSLRKLAAGRFGLVA